MPPQEEYLKKIRTDVTEIKLKQQRLQEQRDKYQYQEKKIATNVKDYSAIDDYETTLATDRKRERDQLVEQAASAESLEDEEKEKKTYKKIANRYIVLAAILDFIDVVTVSASTIITSIVLALSILISKKMREKSIENYAVVIGAIVGDGVPLLGFLPLKLALMVYMRSETVQKVSKLKNKFTAKKTK